MNAGQEIFSEFNSDYPGGQKKVRLVRGDCGNRFFVWYWPNGMIRHSSQVNSTDIDINPYLDDDGAMLGFFTTENGLANGFRVMFRREGRQIAMLRFMNNGSLLHEPRYRLLEDAVAREQAIFPSAALPHPEGFPTTLRHPGSETEVRSGTTPNGVDLSR